MIFLFLLFFILYDWLKNALIVKKKNKAAKNQSDYYKYNQFPASS